MEEFLAGEDGDDDESCEVDDVYTVPTGYPVPSDEMLRQFIKSIHPVSPCVGPTAGPTNKTIWNGQKKEVDTLQSTDRDPHYHSYVMNPS